MENTISGWTGDPFCAVPPPVYERLKQRHEALLSAARQQLHSPSMTAIIGIQTADGFALGADGLTVNEFNRDVSLSTQKIFFAHKPEEYTFAYGWAGATNLKLADGRFDFMDAGKEVIEWMKSHTISPQNDTFFHAFSGQVFQRFASRLRDLYISPVSYPREDELIAGAFFVGYLFGKPIVRQVMFLQQNNYLRTPEIENIDEDFHFGRPHVFSGVKVWLENNSLPVEPDLHRGVDLVQRSLQLCIDAPIQPNGMRFGGRVHIAQITQETAKWAEGFAPIGG